MRGARAPPGSTVLPDEARLRRPALRARDHRRVRVALPAVRRTARRRVTRCTCSRAARPTTSTGATRWPAGWSNAGGVRVGRFPVARPRDLHAFRALSERAFDRRHTLADQEAWFVANGPETARRSWTTCARTGASTTWCCSGRSATTRATSACRRADRAVLVPTAEEDPVLDFPVLGEFFRRPRGYLFLTEEERALSPHRAGGGGAVRRHRRHRARAAPRRRPRSMGWAARPLRRLPRTRRPQQGLRHAHQLLHPVLRGGARDVTLVLAGPVHLDLPDHPRIRALGFVSDAVRDALFDRARARDALALREPLHRAARSVEPRAAGGRERPLRGAARAGGARERRPVLRHVPRVRRGAVVRAGAPREARQLGRQGAAYVEAEYRWPTVMARIEQFLASLRAG
jgi:hypothetical protein